jgi:hypothetical protein
MKYEDTINKTSIIFTNSKGKELFRSSNVKISYRYYETDTREKKVRFDVKDISYSNYGYISHHYMKKVLSLKEKIPVKEEIPTKYTYYTNRYLDIVRAKRYYSIIYRYRRVSVHSIIYKEILPYYVVYDIEDRAPT